MSDGLGNLFQVYVEKTPSGFRLSFLGVKSEADRVIGVPDGFKPPDYVWARSVTVMFTYLRDRVEKVALIE